MRSPAHWVEIDLLRTGGSLMLDEKIPDHEYLVHVSPVERRRKGLLLEKSREMIPSDELAPQDRYRSPDQVDP